MSSGRLRSSPPCFLISQWGKCASKALILLCRHGGDPLQAGPSVALGLQVSRVSLVCSRNFQCVGEGDTHTGNGVRTTETSIYTSRESVQREANILLRGFYDKMLIIGYFEKFLKSLKVPSPRESHGEHCLPL